MRYATQMAAFLIGVIMAAGLAVAGMTQPHKIVAFLDFTGRWEPDLMLVMGGAVTVTFLLYRLRKRRQAPFLAPRFLVPTRRDIDAPLVVGSGIFGIGWGLTGICPGPALTSTGVGSTAIYVYLAGMTGGMLLYRVYEWIRPAIRGRLKQRGRQPAASKA